MATRRVPLARQPGHQRLVPPGPLVLGRAPLKPPAPAADRDRPVSRRSEPSSRTALMGEQPNPWDRLQPQDAMSRHRGAKRRRRWGRSGAISLFTFLRFSRRGRLYLHPRQQIRQRGARRFGSAVNFPPFRRDGQNPRASRPQSLRGQEGFCISYILAPMA